MNFTDNMEHNEKLYLIDLEFTMSPIDDLRLARDLIQRNHALLKDYPSLEDSTKMLKRVISIEMEIQVSRDAQLKEIYD